MTVLRVADVRSRSRRSRRGRARGGRARRPRAARAAACPRPTPAAPAPGRRGRRRRAPCPPRPARAARAGRTARRASARGCARIRSASTDMPSHERRVAVLHVVEQDRRVGQDRPARPTSARCRARATAPRPRAPACALPRSTPREAGDLLGLDRVALVRHRARALLARRGTAPATSRTSVRCRWRTSVAKRSSPAPGQRDRLQRARRGGRAATTWVETRSRASPSRSQHPRLELRVVRRVRADRARDRARPTPASNARSQPLGVAVGLEREPGELEPERRRLGVDAVGAPDAQRVRVLARARRPARRRARARRRATTSPALRAAAAPAPVSSTSEEVSPKWIQRPAGPADAASTSTNAATSWSVTRSRSCTASTVNVARRGSPRASCAPRRARRSSSDGGHLDLAPGLDPRLVGPDPAELGRV